MPALEHQHINRGAAVTGLLKGNGIRGQTSDFACRPQDQATSAQVTDLLQGLQEPRPDFLRLPTQDTDPLHVCRNFHLLHNEAEARRGACWGLNEPPHPPVTSRKQSSQ